MKKKLLLIVCILLAALTLTACSEVLGLAVDLLAEEPAKVVSSEVKDSESSNTASNETKADITVEPADESATDAESAAETAVEAETEEKTEAEAEITSETAMPDIAGVYSSKEDVALYIHTYGCLPSNFITKKQAQELGWPGGSLEPYAPGKSIGGDYFGNYEGTLPKASGRSYHECDIGTTGAKSRGAKRIVFSNDGLIYYTEDHYESFELLYGEE